jgi:hypothetical protein
MKSYILGQGDNQVRKVLIPVPEEYGSADNYLVGGSLDLESKIQTFIDTLISVAQDIGLMVKPDETAVSRNVVIYGKDILFKGSFMPQALKRISRTLPDVKEVYPTSETKIATVQTSGSTSSQKSLDYCVPYVVSTRETLCVIMREITFLRKHGHLTKSQFAKMSSFSFKYFLLHISSEVGGCPILNPIHFLYRGHPDHFTTYTTSLHKTAPVDPWSARIYNTPCSMKIAFSRADPELLVCNPCSVNLHAPQTIASVIRHDLENILIQVTCNRDLAMTFSESSKVKDQDFYNYLVASRPYRPRVLHEIFHNNVQGTKLAYLSKYKNTKTTRIMYGRLKD